MSMTSTRTDGSRGRFRLLLWAVALLLLGPALAHAQEVDLARRHFDRGVVLYRQGQYDAALTEFERSQLLRPSPGLHYNVGQAQRALRRYGQAHASFQRYLADNPELPPQRRAVVRQILDELRPHLAWVQLRELPPGAIVRVDGRRVDARADVPLAVDAGSHVIEISASGRPTRTEEVLAAPGQSLTVAASVRTRPEVVVPVLPRVEPPAPEPVPPPSGPPSVGPGTPPLVVTVPGTPPQTSPPFYRRWWFWTIVGVVAVGVAVGAAAGSSASHTPAGTLHPGSHQFP
jgi:hypothetical protein